MKNGKIISFIVNILTGILFSFPVFSAQSNLEIFNTPNRHYNVSATYNESDIKPEFEKLTVCRTPDYTSLKKIDAFKFEKSLFSKKSKFHFPVQSPPSAKYQLSPYFSGDYILIRSDFVNISFLKELKTTKMLC